MTSNKKNVTLRWGLIKKENFRGFQVFNSNLGKFSLALNFDCFDCIKFRKLKIFIEF